MHQLHFHALGQPRSKGSPEIKRRAKTGRPFVLEKNDCRLWQEVIAWEARIAARAAGLMEPLDVPVSLRLAFRVPCGATPLGRAAAVKPDVDKLSRTVLDALEGVLYVNDSRVVELVAYKRAADASSPPGVHVHLTWGRSTERST